MKPSERKVAAIIVAVVLFFIMLPRTDSMLGLEPTIEKVLLPLVIGAVIYYWDVISRMFGNKGIGKQIVPFEQQAEWLRHNPKLLNLVGIGHDFKVKEAPLQFGKFWVAHLVWRSPAYHKGRQHMWVQLSAKDAKYPWRGEFENPTAARLGYDTTRQMLKQVEPPEKRDPLEFIEDYPETAETVLKHAYGKSSKEVE
jgi:hypothetical protein